MIRFIETEVSPTVFVLDTTGTNALYVRSQLALYKKRWGESLAAKIAIIQDVHEAIAGSTILVPQYVLNALPSTKPIAKYHPIKSVNSLTHYELRAAVIEPNVQFTDKLEQAMEWLEALPDTFTADFEATGLQHPALEELTHLSLGISESEARVIIFAPGLEGPVLEWLVTTEKKQIWHNLSFDSKYLVHRTGKFPKNYEDTQLLAWAYLNHADTFKAKVGLKGLAGGIYGAWGVSADLFGLEHMYNPELIEYAGIDACATYFIAAEFGLFSEKSERIVIPK